MVNVTRATRFLKRSNLFLLGEEVVPELVSKFVISPKEFGQIWSLLVDATHPVDLIFLSAVGWLLVPVAGLLYQPKHKAFRDTYLYQIVDHVSMVARLSILVFLVEILVVVFMALGFEFQSMSKVSQVFAKSLFVSWAVHRLSVFKRYLLGQAVSRAPDKLGRATMVDRLADGILLVCTGFFLLDILDVEMGIGVTSVFAFGSAGTLVVGLATKDAAAMLVNGLMLTTADRIQEGNQVQFGDGTCGIVLKVGWTETTIRNYDELIVVVPNSELGMQRVKNISRVDKCRVMQTLRFRYSDQEKLPQVLDDMLVEIKNACPKVIDDGTRPFRAHWRNYQSDYLEVVVDVHFRVRPSGQPYWDNRQEVLRAIHRAVKKNGVQFVTTYSAQPSVLNKK